MEHSLPPPHELYRWDPGHVRDWLQQNGLGECVEAFSKRGINGEQLMGLTEEQLVFWGTDLKIKPRIQITKYLNQYREKEKILTNAKEKILALTQVRRRSTDLPPPLPQVDYKWDSVDDDSQENPWGSDFESDTDEELEVDSNGNNSQVESSNLSLSELQNETLNTPKNETIQSSPSQQFVMAGVPELIELPAQPMIPRRKAKPQEESPSSLKEDSAEALLSSTASEIKLTIAKKPTILPKPSLNSHNSNLQTTSRVASTAPNKFSQKNSLIRPSEQPPPPPIKPQLPELNSCRLSADEYEVPNTYPLAFSSTSSETQSSSSQSSNHAAESYDPIEDESVPESIDGSSETSSVSGASTPLSPCYDRPKIPPRLIPGQSLIPPPLPRKPSTSKISSPLETQPFRLHEKSVPLPTRSTKTEENGLRLKDGQFKSIGGTLKNKLATLLYSDKSNRATENSPPSLNVSALSLCETAGISTSPPHEMSSMLTKGSKSQEILGKSGNLNSRTSLEDIGSMQNRPLPPVPPLGDLESHSAVSPSSSDSSKEGIEHFIWFHQVERDVAEQILKDTNSGNYVVRPSRRAGEASPYTLSMQYNGRVFHLNIRQKPDCKFALGKEKLNEKTFNSVEELIEYHTIEPIVLTVKGVAAGKTCLMFSPEKR